MENSVLMTLPQSDIVTEYLSAFSKEIITAMEQKNIRPTLLMRERASKEDFEVNLRDVHKLIIFNGHGDINSIFGHKDLTIIKKGENESILNNKITYARSCSSALGLGKAIVNHGEETCFVGYQIPFMFLSNTLWDANPLKDNLARVFLRTSNNFPIGIIKGKLSIQAHEDSRKSMLKEIKKATLREDKDSQAIASTLWNNYSGQVLIGSKDVRLCKQGTGV